MQKSVAILPSGNELRISISGGVAWYPANGTDMDSLKKYADFALYQVKRTNKGIWKSSAWRSTSRKHRPHS